MTLSEWMSVWMYIAIPSLTMLSYHFWRSAEVETEESKEEKAHVCCSHCHCNCGSSNSDNKLVEGAILGAVLF